MKVNFKYGLFLLLIFFGFVSTITDRPMEKTEPITRVSNNICEPSIKILTDEDLIARAINKINIDPSGIRLINPAYTVLFTTEGIAFDPASDAPEFSWSLAGKSHTAPVYSDGKIVYKRDHFTEEYLLNARTIEQQFIIEQPLAPDALSVKISGVVASDGTFSKDGDHWVWKNEAGQVSLSDVYVFDADGKKITARMDVAYNRTTIEVLSKDLRNASFPVTIDPEIGTDLRISTFGTDTDLSDQATNASISYSSTSNKYLVVWEGSSGSDIEIHGQILNGTTGAPEGSDFPISNMGSGSASLQAFEPDVASSGGEFLVVWRGDDNTSPLVDNEYEIFGQRVNSSTGALSGSRIRISDMGTNGSTAYGAFSPAIAYNSTSSEYLVVWSGDDNTGSLADEEYEIYVQRLSSTGVETGSDTKISDVGPDGFNTIQAFAPDVAWNSSDNQYLVVWYGDDVVVPLVDDETEVFMQRLTSTAGETGTNDVRVSAMGPNGNTAYSVANPSIAYNAINNNYFVVWHAEHNSGTLADGENEIYGQSISNLGVQGTTLRLSDMGPDGNISFDALNPAVQHDPNLNQFLVTWQGDDNTSPMVDNELEIHGQLVTGAGAETGSDFRMSDAGANGNVNFNATRPAIVYNGTAREFLITWDADDDDVDAMVDNEYEIFGQRYAELSAEPGGQPTTPDFSSITASSFTVGFLTASGPPDGYIVLRKSGSSPAETPTDQQVYSVGATIGLSTVAYVGSALTFNQSSLAANTGYFYDFFSYNGVNSSTNYRTTAPLEGNVTTLFAEPATQGTLSFTSFGTASIQVNLSVGNGSGRLLVVKAGSAVDVSPADGTAYTANNNIGSAPNLGSSNFVVGSGTGVVTVSGLSLATIYHFKVFEFNGTAALTNYNTSVITNSTGSKSTLSADPVGQPTAINFGSITNTSFTVGFSAASGPPSGYIAVRKSGSAPAQPADLPVDGTSYTVGNTLGGSTVAYVGSTTSFSQSSLNAGTEYYYLILSFNGSGANINYRTTTPLPGSKFTLSIEPAAQPSSLVFSSPTTSSVNLAFTAASGSPSGYLVLRKQGSAATDVPVDATSYTAGNTIGTSAVVYVGAIAGFNDTGLSANTVYHYAVFAFNGSATTLNYLTASPLTGNRTTLQTQPAAQASSILFSSHTTSSYTVDFTGASGPPEGYVVIRKQGSAPTGVPTDGAVYAVENAVGDGIVAFVGSALTFNETGLSSGTAYSYKIFSYNGAGDAVNYLATAAPEGSTITLCATPAVSDITVVGQTTFTVSWPAVTGAANYAMEISSDNFATFFGTYSPKTITTGTDPLTENVSGLSPGVIYKTRVRALNASGASANGEKQKITIPATPVLNTPSPIRQNGFDLAWNAVTGADKYFLDVSTSSTFLSFVSGYQSKEIAGTSLSITELSPGISYYLRLRSFNTSGISPNSDPVLSQATLPATPQPTSVDAADVTANSFKAKWTAAEGATSYELEVSKNDFVDLEPGYNPKVIVNALEEVVSGLLQKTSYKFRIRSKSAAGYSPYSTVISVETKDVTSSQFKINTAPTSTSQPIGFANAVLTVNVQGGTGSRNVRLRYRGILANDFLIENATLKSGDDFDVNIAESMLDDLGLEYYFEATDQAGNTAIPQSTHSFVYKALNANALPTIPNLSAGGKPENYRIISVPYKLENEFAQAIFSGAGAFGDKTEWRLVHYEDGKNKDVQALTNIRQGVGYWFNTRKAVEIKIGEGTVPQHNQSNPFTIALAQGWNQIGDPYPFDIDWDDVQVANPHVVLSSLKVFDPAKRGLASSNTLKMWSGGFVFADAGATLTFPVTLKNTAGGRKANLGITNTSLDQVEWLLPITLKHGDGENDMIGIGMHPEASESKDNFDEITSPRFIDYLEMDTRHDEFFAPYFTRDIVPTSDQYTWNFTVHSSFGEEKAAISWDAESLGTNAAKLYLYDVDEQFMVDMKSVSQYTFSVGNGKSFKFLYTNSEQVWRPDFATISKPYPNPSSGLVTVQLIVKELDTPVVIDVFDLVGKPVRTLVNRTFNTGIYDLTWNGEDSSSAMVPSGIYLIQTKVGSQKNVHKITMK